MLTLYGDVYDKVNNKSYTRLDRAILIYKNTLNFYSNQLFSVRIDWYTDAKSDRTKPKLYSHDSGVTTSGDNLAGNYCYTLYIPENGMSVDIIITDSTGYSITYNVEYVNTNIETDSNKHYDDLLVNYNLPSYEELVNAIEPSSSYDNRELIKRLLLDFREILKNKGTKKSIEKFFQYLGYDTSGTQLNIYDIFKRPDGTTTTTPNRKTDIKTGFYTYLYKCYEQDGLNPDNMPINNINILDNDTLLSHLLNAVNLANIYFTATEQEIESIKLLFQSNIPSYISSYNRTYMISRNNIQEDFNYHLVNIGNVGMRVNKEYVTGSLLKDDVLNVEALWVKPYNFNSLVDGQFLNGSEEILVVNPNTDNKYNEVDGIYGSIIQLPYISDDTVIKINGVVVPNDSMIALVMTDLNKEYMINISYVNSYGEGVYYIYTLKFNEKSIIKPVIKSVSSNTYKLPYKIDDINLTKTGYLTGITETDSILPLIYMPDEVVYNDILKPKFRYLLTDNRYPAFKDAQMNFQLNEVTTSYVQLLDPFISIMAFEYFPGSELYIHDKLVETNTEQPFELQYTYITIKKIFDDENDLIGKDYWYIMSISPGLIFDKETLPLYTRVNNDLISVYDLPDVINRKTYLFSRLTIDLSNQFFHFTDVSGLYDIPSILNHRVFDNIDVPNQDVYNINDIIIAGLNIETLKDAELYDVEFKILYNAPFNLDITDNIDEYVIDYIKERYVKHRVLKRGRYDLYYKYTLFDTVFEGILKNVILMDKDIKLSNGVHYVDLL